MPATISPAARRSVLAAARAAEQDRSAELSVAMLAENAGMSDKHFQRTFRAVIGESPKSYVRRLRLQMAAYLLKWSDAAVTDIAMQAGFDTHSGFTKAFAKAYGLSPVEFRRTSTVSPYMRYTGDEDEVFDIEAFEASKLIVRTQQTPAVRVAAMRHIGPTEKMAEVWPKMVDWARRRGVLNAKSTLLGIHNDYWDDNAEERYRYDAAVVVPDDFDADDEVVTFTMPAGLVAMTEFSGTLDEADAAWRRFADQWLPVSGYQFRAAYAYDRYPVDLVAGGLLKQLLRTLTGIRATLCIPVAK